MIETPVDTVLSHAECTIAPDTSTATAAQRLRDPSVPALVVVSDESVVGILTESDFVVLVAEETGPVPVSDVMSTPVCTIEPTASIRTAADTMRDHGVKHLPVVSDGTYRGLVSAHRLAPYLSAHALDIEWQENPPPLSTDDAAVFARE